MHKSGVARVRSLFRGFKFRFQLIFLLTILISLQSVTAAEKKAELVILNWSEYIDPELVTAFEEQYGVIVRHVYFESDDDRDQILLQTAGNGFDLIMANGAGIGIYRKRGWLQPIDLEKIPNIKFIEKYWLNSFEPAIGYGVPYFWGTLGIAYRKDLVSEPISSWKQLFNPPKELHGKILMVKSSKDVIGMALKSLGYSANSENNEELRQAEKLLLKFKTYIHRYGYVALDETSSLVKGDIVAATVYGGDALNVAEFNENIIYVLPEEGGNIWADFFTISAASKQPELAAAFINFINEPQRAAKNAEEMYLATPNAGAKKLLSNDILSNNVIYPDEKKLSRSEFYKNLSPRANRKRATIFTRIVK